MSASSFFFDDFELDIPTGVIRYRYSTDSGQVFVHELSITFPQVVDIAVLRPAVFALGMAELAHFWKATLAPNIVIRAGKLSEEQIAFWEKLYTKGLGEFFYVNKIDFRGLVRIKCVPEAPEISFGTPTPHEPRRVLVPLGGGKDSLVTGELLKRSGRTFAWFELEPLPFSARLKEASGVTESVVIGRNVAKNFSPVMQLVAEGAPNGHVPITATYLFSAVVAAKLYGYDDVILSLERSADEGNVEYLGEMVNHQYSKTLEFETAAAHYVRTYIDPNLRVFSLLRPFYELQIVGEFARYPQYFDTFVSCNRELKVGSWCGMCAKCAFMFVALSAYLSPPIVIGIFKKNLFEDESLIPLYKELIGKGAQKPFDCVGTFHENLLALYLAGKQYEQAALPLPPVLSALPLAEGQAYEALLTERGPSIAPPDYGML